MTTTRHQDAVKNFIDGIHRELSIGSAQLSTCSTPKCFFANLQAEKHYWTLRRDHERYRQKLRRQSIALQRLSVCIFTCMLPISYRLKVFTVSG
jgi:hypothetical protein